MRTNAVALRRSDNVETRLRRVETAVAVGPLLLVGAMVIGWSLRQAASLVVTVAEVLVRVVARRPWPVEATFASTGNVARRWFVHGFADAARAAEQIRERLDAGHPLPPAGAYDPDRPPPVPLRADDLLHDPTWPTG